MSFLALMLIVSEVGLLAAYCGRFTFPAVFAVSLPLWGLFLFLLRGSLNRCRPAWGTLLILAGVIILAVFLFFQPYQYLDGGWDPGHYVNTGIHIARTGSLTYQDNLLAESEASARELTAAFIRADGTGIKYPGLYIMDINQGLLVPQFLYLYPVWIAIFYTLGGVSAALLVNPFLAVGSVIMIFLIGRRLLGRPYGLLAALLLAVNVIQIWNARFSTAEVLAQFFLLAGFYLWLRYLATGERLAAFLSGLALGEFLLVSITCVLLVPVVIIYLIYRLNKKDLFFAVPFFLLLLQLLFQLFTFTSIYLETVTYFFGRQEIYAALTGFFTIVIMFLLLRKRDLRGCFRIPLIVFILILFVYAYFIRPLGSGSIERFNLRVLGNYLSVYGLLLALAGLCLLIYREKRPEIFFMTAAALVFAVFFIYNKRMVSRYPFSLRRYIPALIPLSVIWITYLFQRLRTKAGVVLTLIAVPLLVLIPLNKNRNLLLAGDYRGAVSFWQRLAEQTEPEGVYLCSHYRWARPLADLCGRQAIAARKGRLSRLAKMLLADGKRVFYLTETEKPYLREVDFQEVYRDCLQTQYLEHGFTFSEKVKKLSLCFSLFEIVPIEEAKTSNGLVDIGRNDVGLAGGWDKSRSFTDKLSGQRFNCRWTGEKAELIIPWFGGRAEQVLVLRAKGMPAEAGETRVSILVDNQPLVEGFYIGPELAEYRIPLPRDIVTGADKQRVLLTIKSNTWTPRDYQISGFPDKLGILLDWIKVERETVYTHSSKAVPRSGAVYTHSSKAVPRSGAVYSHSSIAALSEA